MTTAQEPSLEAPVVLLGVLKDIHNLGVLVLKHALERGGFRVVNAGAMLSQEELINAAIETNAKAILVSSSYGMAAIDAEGLRGKCVEAGLDDDPALHRRQPLGDAPGAQVAGHRGRVQGARLRSRLRAGRPAGAGHRRPEAATSALPT